MLISAHASYYRRVTILRGEVSTPSNPVAQGEAELGRMESRTSDRIPSWTLFLICFLSITLSPFSFPGILTYGASSLTYGLWLEPLFAFTAIFSGRLLGKRDHPTGVASLAFYGVLNFIAFYAFGFQGFVGYDHVVAALLH
jgi:hypothetical protein